VTGTWRGLDPNIIGLVDALNAIESIRTPGSCGGHDHLTLVAFLAERGSPLVLINPYQATQFRRSQGKRAETDRIDARALARFLAVSAPAPNPPPSEALAGLRALTRFRAELVQDRTLALNRLHSAVDLACPELPRGFDDLHCPTALALLRTYLTAANLAAAAPEAVLALVRQASPGRLGAPRRRPAWPSGAGRRSAGNGSGAARGVTAPAAPSWGTAGRRR
jgi:hypothetical protein